MSSYRFGVDFEALVTATQGLADTIDLLKKKDVEDLVPSQDALGSDEVWSAVEEFKDRWEVGLNHLKRDVESMAGILGEVSSNYITLDETGATKMKAALAKVNALPTAEDAGGSRA